MPMCYQTLALTRQSGDHISTLSSPRPASTQPCAIICPRALSPESRGAPDLRPYPLPPAHIAMLSGP